ncbi:hypothetical protein [Isoptericola sp. 178]|uniref:hypothetical protein n=1 Tax=Isoptericola sp. 178 TaxID=3064651 RepID=UPI0027130659|nr:hypothetical protein [Isoptericola sp. 178]MDO8145104.1 hypothetical protein [Isoptericola sp. 178]
MPERAPREPTAPRHGNPQGSEWLTWDPNPPDESWVEEVGADVEPKLTRADRGAALRAELTWARREALGALRADARAEAEDWRATLLPAARLVLGAADRLASETEVFTELADAADFFDERPQLRYDAMALLGQNLTALLNYLGYRPPPKTGEIEDQLTEALVDMFSAKEPDGHLGLQVRGRLWENLYFFRRRLAELIETAESFETSSVVVQQPMREQLRGALVKGARMALPAALAAGITTLVFPPAGAAAGIAVGVAAGGQALLRKALEAATAGMLDKALAGEAETAPPAERWQRASTVAARRLHQVADLLEQEAPDRERVQAWLIDAIGHVYEALRLSHAAGGEGLSYRQRSQLALEALDAVEGWVVANPPYDGVVERLRAAAHRLDSEPQHDFR